MFHAVLFVDVCRKAGGRATGMHARMQSRIIVKYGELELHIREPGGRDLGPERRHQKQNTLEEQVALREINSSLDTTKTQ